jgi:hypothetical protein
MPQGIPDSSLLSRHRLLSLLLGWGKGSVRAKGTTFRQANLVVQRVYVLNPATGEAHRKTSINTRNNHGPFTVENIHHHLTGTDGSNPIRRVNRAMGPPLPIACVPHRIRCLETSLEEKPSLPFAHQQVFLVASATSLAAPHVGIRYLCL